jgi:hypothetical protein
VKSVKVTRVVVNRRQMSQLCEVSKATQWGKGVIIRLSDCNDCKRSRGRE